MGVFATKNIEKNQVCCFYDGFFMTGPCCSVFTTGQHGYGQSAPFNGNPNYVLAGFPTQLRPGGCAQMCNDASTTYTNRNRRKYLEHINVLLSSCQIAPGRLNALAHSCVSSCRADRNFVLIVGTDRL